MSNHSKFHFDFDTERLNVVRLSSVFSDKLLEEITNLLTPKVTKNLPEGWQNVDSSEKARKWISDRLQESTVLQIKTHTEQLVGFIFLYIEELSQPKIDLRFGYLLNGNFWGQGLGTEVLTGFVNWCEESDMISTIAGGVEKGNIGSIKVLEKVGFKQISDSNENPIFYEYSFL